MFSHSQNFSNIYLAFVLALACLQTEQASGQGATFNVPGSSIITTPNQPQSGTFTETNPPLLPPQPTFTQPNFTPPPNIDPYQVQTQQFPVFPQGGQPVYQPQVTPSQFNNQQFGTPQFAPPPQSSFQGTGTNGLPAFDWDTIQNQYIPRVLEHSRARYTYIPGNNGNELGINELEIATTFNKARFLGGPNPLQISPGFVWNFWSGPNSTDYPMFDMPARAYSGYLAFDHVTDTCKLSGFESNLTVGYYSDFSNTSSYAIRWTGKLVGWYRMNNYTVGKFGVEYLDRVNVKLLPAFGLYMTPNPDLKFDLYFPRTKLSQRIPNINNYEAWAYFGAEYGGGSWAIKRRDDSNDQADINEVRSFVGIEWMGTRRVTGFFELGYVFDRKLVYRSNALNSLDLQDALLLSTGFSF